MKQSALKRQKISNIWAKGPKEMRKKEGEENCWKKVSDVAVILGQNILMSLRLEEVRAPLDISLASRVLRPFCEPRKAEITLSSLQMLSALPEQRCRRGQWGFTAKVTLLLPSPSLLRTRDALQCQTWPSLPNCVMQTLDFSPSVVLRLCKETIRLSSMISFLGPFYLNCSVLCSTQGRIRPGMEPHVPCMSTQSTAFLFLS